MPRWTDTKLPNPGKPGFSSIPGEAKMAEELNGRRRAMSGAGDLPFDLSTPSWLIDRKESKLKSFSVKRDLLNLLTKRAVMEGRRPMLAISFWDEDRSETWVLIRQTDLVDPDDSRSR